MTLRGALISVGGSPEPIIISLNEAQAAFVVFVVSQDSKPQVETNIIPRLNYTPQYNCVLVQDSGDLAVCYETIRAAIPKWLEERALSPEAVYVDITGGTKPMSAALAMAGSEHFGQFCYISGTMRDKNNLGVVRTGAEQALRTVNPCDKLATRERARATWLFCNAYADQAGLVLKQAAQKCSAELRKEIETLADFAACFAAVDRFQFSNVYRSYKKLCDRLNLILSNRGQLSLLGSIDRLADHWLAVEKESRSGGERVSATLRELLANAQRRASQARYDDAVARLYRATELFAQGKLYEAFGAKLGWVKRDQIPQEHLNKWVEAFGEDPEEVYKLGVRHAFTALRFSPKPEHAEISCQYDRLDNTLQKRNNSILAHGLQPCTRESFEGFLTRLCEVIRLTQEEIPGWPRMDF